MASKYVKNLKMLGDQLFKDGFPISSAICINASTRMEIMEQLIVDQNTTIKNAENLSIEIRKF